MMKCYAILNIPDGYLDYLGYFPKYRKEFFDVSAAGFDTNNIQGLIAYFNDVHNVNSFELHYTFFDPDHFKELYYLEEYENLLTNGN